MIIFNYSDPLFLRSKKKRSVKNDTEFEKEKINSMKELFQHHNDLIRKETTHFHENGTSQP